MQAYLRLLLLFPIAVAACGPAETAPTPATGLAETPLADSQPPSEPALEATPHGVSIDEDAYAQTRERMVSDQIEARGISDPAVLESMRAVPRHAFVPDSYLPEAYADHPLPIGHGQTISQPYIVALMTEALQVQPGDKVLEVGTGSGYQAAILAEMDMEVYTLEIIPELAEQAAEVLQELGYTNVATRTGDGYFGWDQHAPFDAIMVTAAPDHLPQPLVTQLKEGGRLIIPIGPVGSVQTLWFFEKVGGEMQATNLGGVLFVPLTRE